MRRLFGLIFISSPALAAVHQTAKTVNQHDATLTYRFLVCINALFFAGILIAMAVFVVKNRKTALDMIWTMVPAIMLIVIVGLGWANFRDNHSGETFYAVKFSQ